MRSLLRRVFIPALVAGTAAGAQDGGDERAYIALSGSHIGSLTPMPTPAMLSRRLNGAQLALRYGLRQDESVSMHAFAGSATISVGLASSLSLTAGVTDADCFGCDPSLLLGLGGDMRVFEAGDAAGGGSSLSLAVSGDFGFARVRSSDETALSLGVGAPVTLSFRATQGGLRFAPYLTPVYGIGSTSFGCPAVGIGDCDDSGTRFLIGGGVAVWNALSAISASVGFNHILHENAKPLFGVNVMIGGR